MNRLDEIEKKLTKVDQYLSSGIGISRKHVFSMVIKDLTEITRDLAAVVRELKEKE